MIGVAGTTPRLVGLAAPTAVRLLYGMLSCRVAVAEEGGGEGKCGRMWRGKVKDLGMWLGMPDRLGGFTGRTLLGFSLEFALVSLR